MLYPFAENTNGLGVPIGDLDLEAVELSSNVTHDGRSVVLDSNVVVPGSYRRKNFRYYKVVSRCFSLINIK